MNFINAEIAKLAVNTYITTKISFANMLARICEQLPKSNVDVVTEMVNLIMAQRAYEFNLRSIKASDEMLSNTTNMTR